VAGADPVRAVTVTDVMREFGLGIIDLLKVDIEGSEKELFAAPGTGLSTSTPSAWN
jgi:FkbM family methyltransferase